MWIKIPAGDLINCDQLQMILYSPGKDETIAMQPDTSHFTLCPGNAIDYIAEAIQRGQNYLEVSDCGR